MTGTITWDKTASPAMNDVPHSSTRRCQEDAHHLCACPRPPLRCPELPAGTIRPLSDCRSRQRRFFGFSALASDQLFTPRAGLAVTVLVGPIANVINITFSLLNYKWVIFKTNGNYVREWLRCAAVSSGGVILGTLSLPTLVILIRYLTPFKASAPYIGWAMLLGASVLMSFIGHRRFTFAQAAPVPSANFDDEKLDQSI